MGMVVRIFCLALTCAAFAAQADYNKNKVVAQIHEGPRDYHPTYASIFNTVVVIQGFEIRTNDRRVIKVRSPRMNVDLQDIKDFRRGILIDLRDVVPQGEFLDVVEIQAKVVDCSNHYINFRDPGPQFGSQCKLRVPKTINFYTTSQPLPMGSFEYLLKADFNPLNSIQLDLVKIIKQITSCWKSPFNGDGGSQYDDICKSKGEKVIKAKSCELVNRRQPILTIVRRIDEA